MIPLLLAISLANPGASSPLGPSKSVTNMNGEYLLSNANPSASGEWNSDYGKFENVEYFDVYSPPISTKYKEMF